MNDIHNVDEPRHVFHDRLFSEHPEHWRVGWREFEWPGDRALDYSHAGGLESAPSAAGDPAGRLAQAHADKATSTANADRAFRFRVIMGSCTGAPPSGASTDLARQKANPL